MVLTEAQADVVLFALGTLRDTYEVEARDAGPERAGRLRQKAAEANALWLAIYGELKRRWAA